MINAHEEWPAPRDHFGPMGSCAVTIRARAKVRRRYRVVRHGTCSAMVRRDHNPLSQKKPAGSAGAAAPADRSRHATHCNCRCGVVPARTESAHKPSPQSGHDRPEPPPMLLSSLPNELMVPPKAPP
jgi:hypothetical protein